MHILSMTTLQKPDWHTQNFLEGKEQLFNALTSVTLQRLNSGSKATSTAVAIVILETSQGEEGSVQFAVPPEKGSCACSPHTGV